MRSVRAQLLVAMLGCAMLTLVGSFIAWQGIDRLENQILSITQDEWPIADACMELWIASLATDRARLRYQEAGAASQLEWARSFSKHAMNRLVESRAMAPEMLAELTHLDQELSQKVTLYLDATTEEDRKRLDREINATLTRLEQVLGPEEELRDAAMDRAAEASLVAVRRWHALLVGVTIAAIAIALGLAIWLSRRLVAPLVRLADMTRKLGAGEKIPAYGAYSQDEVGELARCLEEMATKLTASRRALIASEHRYRTLFEHARHGIVVLDPECVILEANPAMSRLLKSTPAKLPGRLFSALLADQARDEFDQSLTKILSEDHPPVELEFGVGDETLVAEVKGVCLPDSRIVLILCDTRKLRRIEQALIQGEKLSAIGQLAAGVAHELRNPLFVISNVIYDLRETLGPKNEFAQQLDIADQENARARKIIDNLLEFSRKSPPEVQTVDPARAIEQIVLLFRKALEERQIKLELRLNSTSHCKFDPDAFKQVGVNLISNAIDAMPGGGTLMLATEGPVRERVVVKVTDTGIGIPTREQRQMFNPFYSTKAVGVGTGLGLWIVRSTVLRFEGRIDVQSEVDQGTTFVLDLAVAEPA